MRLMIGCVKMLLQPGTCSTRPISSSTRSPFGPVCRGQKKTLFGEWLCPAPRAMRRKAVERTWSNGLAQLGLQRRRRQIAAAPLDAVRRFDKHAALGAP